MSSVLQQAAAHWDQYESSIRNQVSGLSWWEAGPALQRHINEKISGRADVDWISHTIHTHLPELPLRRCLSLGCGSGWLERRLAQEGVFEDCDAYDISWESIKSAVLEAQAQAITGIHYGVADINVLRLEAGRYGAVWIHSALHHVRELEYVCEQVANALEPGGLLFLMEYVGPSRFQFPQRQKEVANHCLQLLPPGYRTIVKSYFTASEAWRERSGWQWIVRRLIDRTRDGELLNTVRRRMALRAGRGNGSVRKEGVFFPTERDVISLDPSESVRSAELVPVVEQFFDIVEQRAWGGSILQFLLNNIAGNFADGSPQSEALLRMLIEIEDTLIQVGELNNDFAYIVASPR